MHTHLCTHTHRLSGGAAGGGEECHRGRGVVPQPVPLHTGMLCCTVLYVLHNTMLHNAVLYRAARCCTMLYNAVRCCAMLCYAVLSWTMLCYPVLSCTPLCDAVRSCPTRCCPALPPLRRSTRRAAPRRRGPQVERRSGGGSGGGGGGSGRAAGHGRGPQSSTVAVRPLVGGAPGGALSGRSQTRRRGSPRLVGFTFPQRPVCAPEPPADLQQNGREFRPPGTQIRDKLALASSP